MSSGLLADPPAYSVRRDFTRALHVIAATCLTATLVITFGFATSSQPAIWPAIPALLPMLLGLAVADRYRRAWASSFYLVLGGASLYLFSWAVGGRLDEAAIAQTLIVDLPAIALVMVGGTGARPLSAAWWSASGFVVAHVSSSVGLAAAGMPWEFDLATTGAFLLTATVLVLAWLNRRRSAETRPRFSAAARDEVVAALRYRAERRAAALLHDTLLSDLAAVAATTSPRLPDALADRLSRDLELLEGDWFLQPPSRGETRALGESAVHDAVEHARAQGLSVSVTGDPAALARLDGRRCDELAAAVAQCLANVLRHSGDRQAELAVHGSEREVIVMVVDSGRGFDVSTIAADRLGLRHSVIGRVGEVGGSAQVWSSPGRGTSVVLRVPADALDAVPSVTAEGSR